MTPWTIGCNEWGNKKLLPNQCADLEGGKKKTNHPEHLLATSFKQYWSFWEGCQPSVLWILCVSVAGGWGPGLTGGKDSWPGKKEDVTIFCSCLWNEGSPFAIGHSLRGHGAQMITVLCISKTNCSYGLAILLTPSFSFDSALNQVNCKLHM